MDKMIIGENAGKIWQAMKNIEEISISELARKLDLSAESTALAAGWREKTKFVLDKKTV